MKAASVWHFELRMVALYSEAFSGGIHGRFYDIQKMHVLIRIVSLWLLDRDLLYRTMYILNGEPAIFRFITP